MDQAQPRMWASMHQVSIRKEAREYKEEIKGVAARDLRALYSRAKNFKSKFYGG
jgi:hypothetical protein